MHLLGPPSPSSDSASPSTHAHDPPSPSKQARNSRPRFVFPAQSGKPILLEAARKRERDNVADGDNGKGKRTRQKTRGSARLSQPFGMPLPPSVEEASDVSIQLAVED